MQSRIGRVVTRKDRGAGLARQEAVGGVLGKWLAMGLLGFSLGFQGCSSKDGPKVSTPIDKPDETPDVAGTISTIDSLLQANKGKGKGIISGFLTGEGKTLAGSLRKQASNAAGQRRYLSYNEIPLSGATVLIFNALKPTTVADTTLKTDSTGNYTALLDEGQYFGFAVYLDLETFQLVTTSIPNINPIKDSAIVMDTAVAIEDISAPTVASVYDATAPNSDGLFLVNAIPSTNAKVNIVFSEPMQRESATRLVMGTVDTSNSSTSVVLKDTVKTLTTSWSGDSRELTISVDALEVQTQYAIILPVSMKDLAKNPLEKEYKATFVTVEASEVTAVQFAVATTFPADKESLKPIQNPSITFNRPVEIFSVLKNVKIEPAVVGFWEVFGPRMIFNHKAPLAVGQSYTITLPGNIKSVTGDSLGTDYLFNFTVKDFEGAVALKTGVEKEVALAVEAMFSAYQQGDLGRFGTSFHPNFRTEMDGRIASRQEFLDMIRREASEKQNMSAGFLAPIFDGGAKACKERVSRWKVRADIGIVDDYLWVEAHTAPGTSPRIWDKDLVEIPGASVQWERTGPRFTYQNKKYGFAPDFSSFSGPVNADAARDDIRFFGERLRLTSTVLLEPVKIELKEEFQVDGGILVAGDTAKVAVKNFRIEKSNRKNWRDLDFACDSTAAAVDTTYDILKLVLVKDASAKWLILNAVGGGEVNRENFNNEIKAGDFNVKRIDPINLVQPVNSRDNSADASGRIVFKFKGLQNDSVGGYIVGIAEDPKFTGGRPPYGALFFVKAKGKAGEEQEFSLTGEGKVDSGSNASPILRRVHDLRLPGWERTMYEFVLDKMHDASKGFAGVYNWKVIAIGDTSAAQFLANGFKPDRFYGESDFGMARGYFAVKLFPQGAAFAQFENQQFMPPPQGPGGPMGFSDMDMDGVPDHIERTFKTNPNDRNSYPDFRVDTDGDKLADFLEKLLDPDGSKKLVETPATAAEYAAQVDALKAMGIAWMDSDGDGFPDEIEAMLGYNPHDPNNNPGTRRKADAPSGVFAGKISMGQNTHTINFKVYEDSTEKLMVAYSLYRGNDTLSDTAMAKFHDLNGELMIAITLPQNGPDAGRALLLRGRYDQIQALLMGPVDMIEAVVKTSDNFGGGPYVGQFAASGRGEDVSHYLGGGGGFGPAPVMGPAPGGTMMPGYMPPPPGVTAGSKVVLSKTSAIVIDDFGDTLAVFAGFQFRRQPDGGYEMFAEIRETFTYGMKRSELGGRFMVVGTEWVLDGHFFQERDSSGFRQAIPGRINAKAAKTDVISIDGGIALEGTFTGWIQQDKFGTGLSGGQMPPPPTGGCQPGQPCPPPPTGGCQPGQPCPPPPDGGYMPPPTNSFARPYIRGIKSFQQVLTQDGIQAGGTFHISLNGRVMKVINDSLHITESKFPNCGQVLLSPSLIALTADADAMTREGFLRDSTMLASGRYKVVLIEHQFMMDLPAKLDKARDAQGNIVANVYVTEPRPADQYSMIMQGQCQEMMPGPITGPGPGPGPGPTQGPPMYQGTLDMVKAALVRSNNMVKVAVSETQFDGPITVDPFSLKFDEMKRVTMVVEVGGAARMFVFLSLMGDPVTLLIRDGYPIVFVPMHDGTQPPPPDSTQAPKDSMVACTNCTPPPDSTFHHYDSTQAPKDTSMACTNCTPPQDSTFHHYDSTQAPKDTSVACTNCTPPPPSDTTKPMGPPLYQGTLEMVQALLTEKANQVMVLQGPDTPPILTTVDPASLKFDIEMKATVVVDADGSGKVYMFLGAQADIKLPMKTPEGFAGVIEKKIMTASN